MHLITEVEGKDYYSFSNWEGKKWSIPIKNSKVALCLYEPSGIKGKALKKLFAIAEKSHILGVALKGQYVSFGINKELEDVFERCFGNELEYSVFWGTPCINQKKIIQISREQTILGYCKIGNTQRLYDIFRKEKSMLDYLKKCGVVNIPEALFVGKVSDEFVYVQSTQKKYNSKVTPEFGKIHDVFLEDLYQKTKHKMHFEQTDYYKCLKYLEVNTNKLDSSITDYVDRSVKRILNQYKNGIIDWGVVHGDFTPWNTCTVDGELFVFDFEYSLKNAPGSIDKWHFWMQKKFYEENCSVKKIARDYLNLNDRDEEGLEFYILFYISLYLRRGTQEDIKFANMRAMVLKEIIGEI